MGDISVSYLINTVKDPVATLLYVHGFPFNKSMWIHQFEDLPPGVQVIALDVRGHGGTTSGHGFFSIDVFAEDLNLFIEKLGLRNVVVCGCSMGGYIVLRAYEFNPTLYTALILNDTHCFSDDNAGKTKRFQSIQSVLKNGKRIYSIGFIGKVFSEKSIKNQPGAVELIKASIRRNSERTICSTLLALAARTDTSHVLPGIKVPVLLIRGEFDTLVSLQQINFLLQEIPDVRYVEFSDCAHLPNLENPIRFNGEIKNFLISKVL